MTRVRYYRVMEYDDPDPSDAPSDAGVALAVGRLGEPSATFAVNPVKFWGKLALGLTLILFGILVAILWFTVGPATIGHWEFHLLFWPPFLGVMLLVHLIRNRGVKVLLFPTGLLHLRPGSVESFPWDDIARVHLKAGAGSAVFVKDGDGNLLSSWIVVPTTVIQVWNSWVQVTRTDGAAAKFTTILAEFPDLSREIQTETFARHWPTYRDGFLAGDPVQFGVLAASAEGLTLGKKKLAWADVKKITPSQKLLSIEKKGGWVPWAAVPLEQVPNPHLFYALAHVATGGKVGGEKS